MDDFLRLLQPDCSQATDVKDCFAAGQPDAILDMKLRQIDMSLDPSLGTVVVMDTAGVLAEKDDSMWANELHPTPAGFRHIVRQAVLPALHDHGIG